MRKVFSWIAVVIWMMLIFNFSAQTASESDTLSMGLADKIIAFIHGLGDIPVFSYLGSDAVKTFLLNANHYLRKTAHFCIFAVLGLLVVNLLFAYNKKWARNCVAAIFICFLYAISDEVHQYFVPGRACRMKDVLIDTCGATVSVMLLYIAHKFRRKNG